MKRGIVSQQDDDAQDGLPSRELIRWIALSGSIVSCGLVIVGLTSLILQHRSVRERAV